MKFIKKIFKGLANILIAPFALLYHVTFGRKNGIVKSITKRDKKGKTKPAEVKTASPEEKVETVAPKVETKEVEKELDKITSIDVSISHIKEYAVATVNAIVER